MSTRPKLAIGDILAACGHYAGTDALFLQGYNLLLEDHDQDKKVLEVFCGLGDLSGLLGQNSRFEILGIDISEENIRAARQKFQHLPNVTFLCADAIDLSRYEQDSFDMIVGQAAMHHLAHDLESVSKEYSRLVKERGKVVFIFEPLGHNPLIAAVRAIRISRAEWLDESNLFESALRDFGSNFSRYEVYYFSLFAYVCKVLPGNSNATKWLYRKLNALDQKLFERYPRLRKFAANINVCYWK